MRLLFITCFEILGATTGFIQQWKSGTRFALLDKPDRGTRSVSNRISKQVLSKFKQFWALLLTTIIACGTTCAVQADTLLEYRRSGESQANESLANLAPKFDPSATPATFNEPTKTTVPASPPADSRRLGPQSQQPLGSTTQQSKRKPASFALPVESLATAGTGLAIVVGLFMICMWLLKRGGPKPTSPLPADAVSVLGRVPLANRSFAQLLQIGNKLVLVAVTADGVTPITEVTDPNEVTRLLGICLRNRKQSSTAEFQQVLEQLSKEPAKGFLGNQASTAYAQVNR